MNDILTTILYGVISSIIAATIFELARKNSSWIPSPSENKWGKMMQDQEIKKN